ncbi:hypothetical protein BCR41DRAFT_422308 [Lobosporangium transversale]|uniref:Uncharacterized protein n=1 Tax=Lobosporangium transversale TaxID=64571 RepID=A0A1Y2GRT0_9FUNG|nr:hypothetical protein BCR41DRAFT_422308 [Lobosporangium transversale]ORZ15542.1 hypothetical protein BCR41DRAFT_422308 [Lobosporangium transversale]|eukprot:XP_021881290.1 hypothetical protein BCR41DRAFT_422308 [Lobosporangium transversale]
MTQQYQRFRKADIIEEVGVRIASISASNGDSSYYVCLQDIQDVFPDAQRFKLDGHPILFLQDSNGNRIEPPRIAFYPDKILDVITAEPQACNCNSSSNSSTSASSNSMAVISLSALGVPTNLASQDILPIIKLEMMLEKSNMVIDLLLEARKKDDEMLKLQLGKFLQNNDEDKQLGNLYRITTETGHVKWVCIDHYRWTYGEAEQKVFKKVVGLNGGEYDLHLGKVIITLKSKTTAEEFFNALTNARRVYELDISFDWNWSKSDLEAFEEALKKSSVSILRLELGEFQESTTKEILSMAPRYGMLVHIIELSSMKAIHIVLPPNTIKVPSLQLSRPPHLQKLTIEMKPREIDAILELSEALKTNKTLTTLDLMCNRIGDKGVMALSEGLKANRTLTTLDLMGNSIGKEGALALLEVLKTNTTLVTLDLEYDSLGKEGILLLSKTNTTLTSLSFSSKAIGDEGALVLSETLKANTTLTALDLRYNSIGKEGALVLSQALKINTTLTCLNLRYNSVGDEGALALSEALKVNTTLTTLALWCNSVGSEGALVLPQALKVNTTL